MSSHKCYLGSEGLKVVYSLPNFSNTLKALCLITRFIIVHEADFGFLPFSDFYDYLPHIRDLYLYFSGRELRNRSVRLGKNKSALDHVLRSVSVRARLERCRS